MTAHLTIVRDEAARMRDGVVLRANIYHPTAPGRWPTLLARTPYGKDLPGASAWLDPVRAAAAGFMVVIQDTRGRFASDGVWEPFMHEAADGFDTVEWAARLPGSSGRVGMFGLSYWGSTQWLAAIAQPPSLGAIAPAMTWSDPGDGALARGGAMELGLELIWALEQGIDDARRRGEPVQELIDELDHLMQTGFWELPAGAPALRHGVVDLGGIRAGPAVADAARVVGHHDRVRVPVLSIGGWYDCFAQGVLDNHCAVAPRRGRLIVGPWTHSNFTEGIGGLTFGLRARRDDVTTLQLDWFHAQLTGA
ncbi:MAG: CocE/NonD family hydrolase, partial [Solirubrobacteraceae bacterium]